MIFKKVSSNFLIISLKVDDQVLEVIPDGSSISLYISKIWLESEGRNRGSKFFFSLPIIKG